MINRGSGRRQTFLNDTDHQQFTTLLEDIWIRWDVEIFAYCCMSTHYHLLVRTPRGNLSRVMRHVDGLYTQRFNRKYGRDGPLFRGRYKSILIDADAYLLQLVRYIHLNPVDAGIVDDPRAYPWSSHRLYLSKHSPSWLARDQVLGHFRNIKAFEQFVAEGNEQSLTTFYRRKRWSPFLGEQEFLTRVLSQVKHSPETPRAQTTPHLPDIEAVARLVCHELGVPHESVLVGHRGKENIPRNLAIYVASRIAGFTHAEIRRYFQLGTDGAVSKICQRAAELVLRDERLGKFVRQIATARYGGE